MGEQHLEPAVSEGNRSALAPLNRALLRQSERLAAFLEIGTAISSAREVDELLQRVMDRLTGLLGAEASTLFMFDEQKAELWSRVLRGAALKEIRLPAERGLAGQAVSTGRTLRVGDAYGDRRFHPEIDRLSGFKTRSVIAAPLRHVSGRILGAIEVLDRKADAFDAEDEALVEAVATQIAGVIDNVLLLERLRAQNDTLLETQRHLSQAVQDRDLLYEVERAVSSVEGQLDLLNLILAQGTCAIGALAGSILLLERERAALFFRSATGERSEALLSMSLKAGQGIVGKVAQTGTAIRMLEAQASPAYDPAIAKKLGVEIHSVLCVPIFGEDRILGSLELLNKPGGFSEGDERMATLLAGQTGRAILLRRAREEGERRGRLEAIGQMLSGVLHDLRTPLNVISGYAELIAGEQDGAEREKMSEIIAKQVEHISAMTRETLAFARGERALLLRKVFMHQFGREVEAFLRKDLERTGVELQIQTLYTGAARIDENKLKRLISNIARNAVQAMPDGGQFSLIMDREGNDLVLRFADNGPGIPAEISDKLFESFVTARKANGSGLGLAIVKKIAKEHGGDVTCTSRPGEGTTFEVRLPLEA